MSAVNSHGCANASACTAMVPPSKLACLACWRLLPKPLQEAIYATYNTDRAAWSENVLQARIIWREHHEKTKGTAL